MKLTAKIKRFMADEDGSMSIMILPMFILLIVLSGVSLDLYIEETYREDLQDALDRGVLAAAKPTQSLDKETVIWSYINSRTFNDKQAHANIEIDEGAKYTSIKAGSGFEMDTIIFSLLLTDTMPIITSNEAYEGEENVELSLVLDISGSMSRETSPGTGEKRLDVLKGAAKQFVSGLLTASDPQRLSVSMVPYAGQVNAGPFFDMIAQGRIYGSYANSCIEFTDADYATSELPAANSRVQTPQFQNFRYEADYGNDAEWGWCPGDGSNVYSRGIVPMTENVATLHTAIDGFMGHDGTGTNNGIKWGLALLDPTTQPLIATLASPSGGGVVDAAFANRPAPFTEIRTDKYMVVMTDGNIRYQNRPSSTYLSSSSWQDYWGAGPQKDSYGRTRNLLSRYSSSRSILTSTTARNLDEALRSAQFLDLCDIARANNITVFTIGFDIDVSDDAYNEMRDCATVPGNFFDVDGNQLYDAFDAIKAEIKRLQLTQ